MEIKEDPELISSLPAFHATENDTESLSISSIMKVTTKSKKEDDFDINSFSKHRTSWTHEDEETLNRILQQVQGCAKLISLANSWYRSINRRITAFTAFSVSLLTVLTSLQLYDSVNGIMVSGYVAAFSAVFSSLKLFAVGIVTIFKYVERETKCIQLEDSCAKLQESVRNLKATPSAYRLSPTIVLQKIIRRYLDIRRGMLQINIITDQADNYRVEVNALKDRSESTKDVYLSVIDDFGEL
jgi:hypothetical protein